jgi:hypothetical protein
VLVRQFDGGGCTDNNGGNVSKSEDGWNGSKIVLC